MDISRSFSYMFKDSSWFLKVFIGGIFVMLSGIVVGIPFLLGYEIEYLRAALGHDDIVLPEWRNVRRLFRQGLIVLFAALLYAAVLAVIVGAAFGTPTAAELIGILCIFLFCWLPLVLIQYAHRPAFFSCFSVSDIAKRTLRHPLMYVVALAAGFLTVASSVSLGWMSMIVGWPFVVFWGILAESHILAQLAKL
ncbi:MAG TPA: DUF4013 domain-containing protein [Bacteroidota bacterium]|nr:DUF4013 domain-containing protein [Bacteroidota bacterium]